MRSWRILHVLGVIGVITAIAIALPATVFAAPPPKTAHYVIFTSNRVPILNIGEVGTLTLDLQGRPDAFTFNWSYRGITDGSPASASGTGSGSGGAGSGSRDLTVNRYDIAVGCPRLRATRDREDRIVVPKFLVFIDSILLDAERLPEFSASNRVRRADQDLPAFQRPVRPSE